MLPPVDVRPIARLVIGRHGASAAAVVDEYFENCRANGDMQGHLLWRQVLEILRAMDEGRVA